MYRPSFTAHTPKKEPVVCPQKEEEDTSPVTVNKCPPSANEVKVEVAAGKNDALFLSRKKNQLVSSLDVEVVDDVVLFLKMWMGPCWVLMEGDLVLAEVGHMIELV